LRMKGGRSLQKSVAQCCIAIFTKKDEQARPLVANFLA
jgi:hypothetical protein